MRKSFGFLLAVGVLAAMPALAGNLTFDNGQPAWHSSTCVKPVPSKSVLAAHPETAGNDMNALISQYNAYADAAQDYMDCISGEAENDQDSIGKAIASGAEAEIAAMRAEVEKLAPSSRVPK